MLEEKDEVEVRSAKKTSEFWNQKMASSKQENI